MEIGRVGELHRTAYSRLPSQSRKMPANLVQTSIRQLTLHDSILRPSLRPVLRLNSAINWTCSVKRAGRDLRGPPGIRRSATRRAEIKEVPGEDVRWFGFASQSSASPH